MDQANSLRNMVQTSGEQANPAAAPSARVIAVTSGKGGVGKTNFTVNLAIHMARMGKRVVILDADFGLANIEVIFGLFSKYNLSHVMFGGKSVEEVLTNGPFGIKFISGGSGLKELANLTDKQMGYLIDNISYLDSYADIILIDTGAGISHSVINFVKASDETIVVTTPEPTSVMDAYALIKAMKEEKTDMPQFKLVVNRADDINEGKEIYGKLKMVSERFLGVPLSYLGVIPYDSDLVKAVKKQQPAMLLFPDCQFSKALEEITERLFDIPPKSQSQGIRSFLRKLASVFAG